MKEQLRRHRIDLAYFLGIITLTILMTSPQIYDHSIIIGVDSVFHFNRFFDTMNQLHSAKFNYFQSNFGFNQSGRVVNALYGPLMAYFHGFLLLITHSWFKYELLSNLVLSLLSFYSMYYLCRQFAVRKTYAYLASLLYSMSSSVAIWTMSQQFTGWGSALVPLGISGCLTFFDTKFSWRSVLKLAIPISLILQAHILSSLIVCLALISFFLVALFQHNLKPLLLNTLGAVGITLFLTGNVWGAILNIYTDNHLVGTWPFDNMGAMTTLLNTGSPYTPDVYPAYGIVFSLLIIFAVSISILNWSHVSSINKTVTVTILIFIVLASPLLPWTFIGNAIPSLKTFLQFPRRFIVVPQALSLLLVGMNITELKIKEQPILIASVFAIVFSLSANITTISQQSAAWNSNQVAFTTQHLLYQYQDPNQTRSALRSPNLIDGLNAIKKETLDYIPSKHKVTSDSQSLQFAYPLYSNIMLNHDEHLSTKVQKNGTLLLSINSSKVKKYTLPVVLYKKSQLYQNNHLISWQHRHVNDINQPIVTLRPGINHFQISYRSGLLFTLLLMLSGLSWTGILIFLCYLRWQKRQYSHRFLRQP